MESEVRVRTSDGIHSARIDRVAGCASPTHSRPSIEVAPIERSGLFANSTASAGKLRYSPLNPRMVTIPMKG